jgi:hypothetical protein
MDALLPERANGARQDALEQVPTFAEGVGLPKAFRTHELHLAGARFG